MFLHACTILIFLWSRCPPRRLEFAVLFVFAEMSAVHLFGVCRNVCLVFFFPEVVFLLGNVSNVSCLFISFYLDVLFLELADTQMATVGASTAFFPPHPRLGFSECS